MVDLGKANPSNFGERLSGSQTPSAKYDRNIREVNMPMPQLLFETPPGTFTGTGVAEIVELDPTAIVPPKTIIQLDHAWQVHVSWTIADNVPWNFIGGTWYIQAFLERIGPEPDLIVNGVPQEVVWNNPGPFEVFIDPDGTLQVEKGMYRLAVSVIFKDWQGVPQETAAFQDGPTLQFYQV
jgi:hypothetical protein